MSNWRTILAIASLACFSSFCTLASRAPVRGYLFSVEEPSDRGAPHAFLVFPSRPGPSQQRRAEFVCEAYRRDLEMVGEAHLRTSEVIVTYWVLAGPRTQTHESCRWLLDHYDYGRAMLVATAAGSPGAVGPLLVAFSHPRDSTETAEVLVFDLSDFSNDDLDRAFAVWKGQVSRDPAVWQDGFQMIVVREATRNFLQKYGSEILKAAKAKTD